MTAWTVGVTVLNFFSRGWTNLDNFNVKIERLTSQRMVGIQLHLLLIHLNNGGRQHAFFRL